MNKSELIEKINRQKKYSNKICIIGLLPLTVVTVYVIFFLNKTSIFYENKIIIPCFIIIGITNIGIFIWLMFRNIRKIGLVCPKCDKIINVNLYRKVLSTLKCGKCGEIIITENSTS